MTAPAPLPAKRLPARDFLRSVEDRDLVYFLCNVGDGDAQVVLLPVDVTGRRRAVIVDVASRRKMVALLKSLAGAELLPTGPEAADGAPAALAPGSIALAVASHPHEDHIGGMAEVIDEFGLAISEFWDPGYFHPGASYHEMMAAIERQPYLLYAQPTSGLRRWIGNVEITVLAPSVQLRNRFDTYGVELNDSSLSLRFEFPAARVVQRDEERNYVSSRTTRSLVVGGDAQTLSWSFVATDFPALHTSDSAAAKALRASTGADPLRATVLKVAHHASKHGVNLELIERMAPSLTLVSCVGGSGSYGFPHTVAQGLIREALHPVASSRKDHPPDHELNIFYTADRDDKDDPLGTIGVVLGPGGWTMWRFGDEPGDEIDLSKGRRWTRRD